MGDRICIRWRKKGKYYYFNLIYLMISNNILQELVLIWEIAFVQDEEKKGKYYHFNLIYLMIFNNILQELVPIWELAFVLNVAGKEEKYLNYSSL